MLGKLTVSSQNLPKNVDHNEKLSSFLYDTDHIVKKSQTIHHTRLMPRRNTKTGRLETSVCRSQLLNETEVWDICIAHFDKYAPKPAIGRCVGLAKYAFNVGLKFDADGQPYKEHANIIGWSDDVNIPDTEKKHIWKNQSQQMAPFFKYIPRIKTEP